MQTTWSYTRCHFGVAVRDVTPPVGIYARSWGAATHEVAEGVHRPLTATITLFAPIEQEAQVLVLVALDLGWFQHAQDEQDLRLAVMRESKLDEASLLINLSHTHAGANINSQLSGMPGSELIKPYLASLTQQICEAIREARSTAVPVWITYGQGRCDLAANRDYWDAGAGRWACGFNPASTADDTLLVGRVTDDNEQVRATIFNYACHPTTLAWQNRLLSPDFVGAAREVLERVFDAPAMFLQGASGELAPRDDYVGDPAVADRNGRRLGYAAVAALESLPPPANRLNYDGIVASGADLGTWSYRRCSDEQLAGAPTLQAKMIEVSIERKALPDEDLQAQFDASSDHRTREKLLRRMSIKQALGDNSTYQMPIWLWRLGQATLVAVPNEPYSLFQQVLRERYRPTPLLVLGVTNGTLGYLSPQDTYGKGLYQEQQSPFAAGSLERAIDDTIAAVDTMQP